MDKERQQWLQSVAQFYNDINATVYCPSCKEGKLFIRDVAFDDNNIAKGGERYIQCPVCDKFEVVLYRIPPQNWYFKR